MVASKMFFVAVVVMFCIGSARAASAQDDKIVSLPGVTVDFDQYSGYLDINATEQSKFFYWLQESPKPNKNLVLWLNGGPGCSSLGGLLSENGAFFPNEDGTVTMNAEAWNQQANMLYLESPAGVGFSVGRPSAEQIGDVRTAIDNKIALLEFFKRFPAYLDYNFYISGESYAGHYIPTLVHQLMLHQGPQFNNFRGFAVGNPTTNITDDFFYGTYRSWFANGITSPPTYAQIQEQCFTPGKWLEPGAACDDLLQKAQEEQGNINPYDLDVKVCSESKRRLAESYQRLLMNPSSSRRHSSGSPPQIIPWRPCEDNYVETWLNREDVRKAIHADPSVKHWTQCTSSPDWDYNYDDFYTSMIPLYTQFLKTSMKVIVFSGTADTVVPYLGTQRWVYRLNADLGQKTVTSWSPWSTADQPEQTAGYLVEFERMSFVVVRHAAHMVPASNPRAGMAVLNYLLNDKLE